MAGVWLTVAAVGTVSIVLKAFGPVVLGGRELPPRLRRLVAFMAPTLLAALIATQVLGSGRQLVVDARAVGLLTAGVALWLRVPTLLVVVLAAAATAVTRAVSGG